LCRLAVTRAVAKVPGVISEEVNLQRDDVVVRYDDRTTSPSAISAAIAAAGYRPHPVR
jgi:copper chaperone CopZ